MQQLHDVLAWVVVIGNAIVGAWCLGAHWVPALRVRPVWWSVIAAEVAVGAQVVLGVLMLTAGGLEVGDFHVFYGFLTIVAIAILYSYRFSIRAWQYLLYGFGSLFIMGLGIRAMTLA